MSKDIGTSVKAFAKRVCSKVSNTLAKKLSLHKKETKCNADRKRFDLTENHSSSQTPAEPSSSTRQPSSITQASSSKQRSSITQTKATRNPTERTTVPSQMISQPLNRRGTPTSSDNIEPYSCVPVRSLMDLSATRPGALKRSPAVWDLTIYSNEDSSAQATQATPIVSHPSTESKPLVAEPRFPFWYSLPEFALFPELPTEIRLHVWDIVAEFARTVQFTYNQVERKLVSLTPAPVVLSINRESRGETFKKFMCIQNQAGAAPIYINLKMDICYFRFTRGLENLNPTAMSDLLNGMFPRTTDNDPDTCALPRSPIRHVAIDVEMITHRSQIARVFGFHDVFFQPRESMNFPHLETLNVVLVPDSVKPGYDLSALAHLNEYESRGDYGDDFWQRYSEAQILSHLRRVEEKQGIRDRLMRVKTRSNSLAGRSNNLAPRLYTYNSGHFSPVPSSLNNGLNTVFKCRVNLDRFQVEVKGWKAPELRYVTFK